MSTLSIPTATRAPSASATGGLLGALVAPGALGASTAAIALPSIAQDLGLSGGQVVWILSGYILAAAIAVPVIGRLGDMRGVRTVLPARGSRPRARCWPRSRARSPSSSPPSSCRARPSARCPSRPSPSSRRASTARSARSRSAR